MGHEGTLVAWEGAMTTSVFKFRSKFTACATVLACAVVLSVAAYARGGGGHGGGGGFHGGGGFRGGGASMVEAFVAAASISAADTSVAVARSPRDLILPRT
jgi:hypothetical protein